MRFALALTFVLSLILAPSAFAGVATVTRNGVNEIRLDDVAGSGDVITTSKEPSTGNALVTDSDGLASTACTVTDTTANCLASSVFTLNLQVAGPHTVTLGTNDMPATVLGGPDNDVIVDNSTAGDILRGKDGTDTVSYANRTADISVSLDGGANDGTGMEGDLVEAEIVIGGSGNDTLTGGAGAETLDGADGNDKITGGPGADTLIGGAGDDRFFAADGEVDTVMCGPDTDTVVSADPGDVLQDCEILPGAGTPTPTPTATVTAHPTATATAKATVTPTATVSATPTPTGTPSLSVRKRTLATVRSKGVRFTLKCPVNCAASGKLTDTKRHTLGRVAVTVTAGKVSKTIKLYKRARKRLKKVTSAQLKLTITVVPTGGQPIKLTRRFSV